MKSRKQNFAEQITENRRIAGLTPVVSVLTFIQGRRATRLPLAILFRRFAAG